MLKMCSVCNAGVYLEQDGYGLLLDGVSGDYAPFSGTSDAIFSQMLRSDGDFSALRALVFSHDHIDHYDPVRTEQLICQRSCECWLPNEKIPASGRIQCGPFSVCFDEVPHIPGFVDPVRHFVFYVDSGESQLYFAADAIVSAKMHRDLLRGKSPDFIFMNSVHFASDELRALFLHAAQKRVYVYHFPERRNDRFGYIRKTEKILQETSPASDICLIDRYPKML